MQLRHPHPYLQPHSDGGFISFAHRGGSPHLPENSVAAFSHAIELGYRYLETDVQVTLDGVLVAFHDKNLLRTCGVDRDISSMTRNELASVRIDDLEPVPLLAELYERFPNAYINIDAKSDESVEPLIDFLNTNDVLGRTCVGSFSHRRLKVIRSAFGREVCTSASPREVAAWLAGAPIHSPSCLQVPLRQSRIDIVTKRRIERSERNGLPVHVWTIDDPQVAQNLIDWGVHGIMTDDAQMLRRIADQNQIWH